MSLETGMCVVVLGGGGVRWEERKRGRQGWSCVVQEVCCRRSSIFMTKSFDRPEPDIV